MCEGMLSCALTMPFQRSDRTQKFWRVFGKSIAFLVIMISCRLFIKLLLFLLLLLLSALLFQPVLLLNSSFLCKSLLLDLCGSKQSDGSGLHLCRTTSDIFSLLKPCPRR